MGQIEDLFAEIPRDPSSRKPDEAPPPPGAPSDVVDLFEKLTLKLHSDGWKHYSARAILHRIRWHFRVERGDREWKCNNNWTPSLSRWVMKRHPQLDGFFETRSSPGAKDGEGGDDE